jgi:hypothetical protein
MKFDMNKAKAEAEKSMTNPLLELVVLGSQGAGKSYAIGTLGVKTLYLYGTKEEHGPKTANVKGAGNIVPICIDHYNGEALSADNSLEYIYTILTDGKYLRDEGYKAIVFDGLSVLETIVKNTTAFRERCKTAGGKHNPYKETEASIEIIGGIINMMKACQRELGCHIVMTGTLDVKSVDGFGAIEEAAPKLAGYGLAEALNSFFGDIVVVGQMTKNGESKYKFQFLSDLTKVSKDENGQQKKVLNFRPRLSGLEVAPVIDADLAALAKLKRDKMGA